VVATPPFGCFRGTDEASPPTAILRYSSSMLFEPRDEALIARAKSW
jgi:hypothetical protein